MDTVMQLRAYGPEADRALAEAEAADLPAGGRTFLPGRTRGACPAERSGRRNGQRGDGSAFADGADALRENRRRL